MGIGRVIYAFSKERRVNFEEFPEASGQDFCEAKERAED